MIVLILPELDRVSHRLIVELGIERADPPFLIGGFDEIDVLGAQDALA